MGKQAPWIRFFPSDWLAGTRGLSASETGIYITLIASMYERGEPVPEDHKRLARLCGASNSTFQSALETLVVAGKLLRVDGGLWNERVGKERVYLSEKSQVGLQAATARWAKTQQNQRPPDANAMHPQSVGNAIPDARYQIPEEVVEEGRKRPPPAVRDRKVLCPEGFTPSDGTTAKGRAMGLTIPEMLAEAEKMENWSRGKGERRIDWDLVLRGFFARAVERKATARGSPPKRQGNGKSWGDVARFVMPEEKSDEPSSILDLLPAPAHTQ